MEKVTVSKARSKAELRIKLDNLRLIVGFGQTHNLKDI